MKRKLSNILALLLICLGLPAHAQAQSGARAVTTGQAAVVVQFGDGTYVMRSVTFSGESISGLKLLARTGLDVVMSSALVCRIEKDGCHYPEEPCFCGCSGAPCLFWSYWHWKEDRWVFATAGAADYRVHDGEIDGWHWSGDPPDVHPSLADIEDMRRIAPGVPRVTSGCTGIDIDAPFQGDDNGDGAVTAHARALDGSNPDQELALSRYDGEYAGAFANLIPGDYAVQIQVSDPDGVNASTSWLVTTTVGSAADMTISPANAWIHQEITFSDVSRGITSTVQTWDFGDDSPVMHGDRVKHAYALPGMYTTTLTVQNACGSAARQAPVHVTAYQIILPFVYKQALIPGIEEKERP